MKIEKSEYITIPQLARILGISRIAVYKKVRKGQIKAMRVGKIYLIPRVSVSNILGKTLGEEDKHQIDEAVRKTVKEYGEVLKLLGRE
ncbi:MAG: helix-turn-helix domain-containing protein [Candidatus Omnitrophica bacterium]|nr:helix-turn-helix domain-containing protein [Candidatus Omnitrophota bacterium]